MCEDGVSLRSTAHPTSWWRTILGWFWQRDISLDSVVDAEVDLPDTEDGDD